VTSEDPWVSVAELAKLKGFSRQNAHKRVDDFAARGLLELRGQGRSKKVSLSAFDAAVDLTENPAKKPDDDAPVLFKDAKARTEHYKSELARLDLEERLGQLRPIDEIADALTTLGAEILRSTEDMDRWAEELFASARRDSLAKFRKLFKQRRREWAQRAAERLADAAEQAGK
jgi:hypothetical protein